MKAPIPVPQIMSNNSHGAGHPANRLSCAMRLHSSSMILIVASPLRPPPCKVKILSPVIFVLPFYSKITRKCLGKTLINGQRRGDVFSRGRRLCRAESPTALGPHCCSNANKGPSVFGVDQYYFFSLMRCRCFKVSESGAFTSTMSADNRTVRVLSLGEAAHSISTRKCALLTTLNSRWRRCPWIVVHDSPRILG